MNKVKKGDVVTLEFENLVSSNTFIVESTSLEEGEVLLKHPLFPKILIKAKDVKLNSVYANLKDSTERCLDFANNNKQLLDYNTVADLEALCAYFVVTRKLTPRQKHTLSSMCGRIASIKFNDDTKIAIKYVKENAGVLDEFNSMWYRKFYNSGLFSGRHSYASTKQREVIFNIAGAVLAELETPTASKWYNLFILIITRI